MHHKENENMGNVSSAVKVKQEPSESRMPLRPTSSFGSSQDDNRASPVKQELDDLVQRYLNPAAFLNPDTKPVKSEESNRSQQLYTMEGPEPAGQQSTAKNLPIADYLPPPPVLFKEYISSAEIQYTPEGALKEAVKMVQSLKSRMKTLEFESKLREQVWMREIQNLENQGTPTTLIAVCGATGAGKSSILNAILDDNIVPTSGMRACTAVVTEIAYHNKPTIEADVSFLSLAEWKAELAVLLHDLIDEDGTIKRSVDLKSDAGIAWSKVHAVYPSIRQEQLVNMTADQIIAGDQNIAKILGTSKRVVAKDSRTFAKEIAKYIDSKDQKRGNKKDKEKEKPKEKSLMNKIREAAGMNPRNRTEVFNDADAPALWPLIRQVNVRCRAAALSTGAVLVDLPGVADANAARNNVAKDYMKKCNCIWILAPITRAVDDKTARDLLGDAFKLQLKMDKLKKVLCLWYVVSDGNYDDHTITFIASKCDDISCSEVIRALRLDDDPTLEEIINRIEENENETSEWQEKESAAKRSVKAIEKELKTLREFCKEYQDHLDALEDGAAFTPRLTAKKATTAANASKKRKHKGKTADRSPKRRKTDISGEEDDDDFIVSDEHSESEEDSESDQGPESDSSDQESDSDKSNNEDAEESEEPEEEVVTKESLEAKVKEYKDKIKEARGRLTEARQKRKEASDQLATLKKKLVRVQREKNAYCSLKRSEFSREVLKEDFRTGLKDLDDAEAEERDPEHFNPNVNLRDYDAIDLPVFTCSSRDYVRLKGQVKGDGEPTCFSNVEDTGIPALQKWCHQLTVRSREKAARTFFNQLKAFLVGVESYMQGISEVTALDRATLRRQWDSGLIGDEPMSELRVDAIDAFSKPKGVTGILLTRFGHNVDLCVGNLQEHFKDGLEEKCRVGAENAADAAVQTSDEFAASMHWATYRATLRRYGSWRRDLNAELTLPFTRNIANSWAEVFETDLFVDFEATVTSTVNELLGEVEESAAPGLKDRVRRQGELCLEEARVALQKIMQVIRETLHSQQKDVSRCMAPHVQGQLQEAYDTAMLERGTGSVARQKAVFHNFVEEQKEEIFEDGAEVIMERLAAIAEAIGEDLDNELAELAKKIEVNISVLWEGVRDDPRQIQAREQILEMATSIKKQIELWTEAGKKYKDSHSEIVGKGGPMDTD